MRIIAALLTVATASLTLAQSAEKKPVTLDSLGAGMMRMIAEFGGQPIWAPGGQRFALRRGDKVVLYDIATGTEKDLFTTTEAAKLARASQPDKVMAWENRRVTEQRLQWSADGKHILVILSGDLFLWSEATGKLEQLTATEIAERDPKLSPDATKVSFRRGFELYVEDIATKKVTQLTTDGSTYRWNAMLDWVYPEELDLGTAHWWSPDSKKIAYMQFDVSGEIMYPHVDHLPVTAVAEPERYPKAGTPNADVRVGVVSITGGETKWLDFGEIRDHLLARIHWTPDSQNVIAHRLNRVQDQLRILSANATTGAATLLIEEKSASWINVTDDFQILTDGRILRSSEQDGFRHLYLHAADGKLRKRITRGEWEVSRIACVDEKAERVWYTGTEASPLERHLYAVGFDGKGKNRLTEAKGSHSISMSPACDHYIDTYSNLDNPSRATLNKGTGAEIKVWREADRKILDEFDILKTELHNFKTAGGVTLYARLIKPKNFDQSKKYPVIVSVYGGPHAQSVRDSFSGISWDQVMAHKGFVIWQVDNRGSFGRGLKFESALYRRLGRTELEDQLEGIKYLASLGFADTTRVGIQGWSYGGYMTLYCLLHAPDVFHYGAAGAAVTDWRNYDTIYTERYLGTPQQNEQGYKDSSPVNAAANLKGRLLLLHNIEDDNVLFANALQMMNALQQAGKPYESLIYPQKSHGVSGKARAHMMQQQTTFFEQMLK